MILLDTNVVSEPIRRHPDSRVLDWLDAQVIETLYLSTVSLGELLSGVENLPAGRRRTALAALERQIADLFDDRIISFASPPPRRTRKLSPERAVKGTRSLSQMVKSRALRHLAIFGWPPATRPRFEPRV
jgi:predicted nucleic acid-binding protein